MITFKHSLSIFSSKSETAQLLLFLLKALVFVAIMACIVFVLVLPQYTTSYNAALIDKRERIAAIEEPKIVLVGDSNLAFGINSQMIEEAMGMPVVNYGLHGSLGQVLAAEMVKPYIREGDIIVLAPTSYDRVDDPDYVLAWLTIEDHVSLWMDLPASAYDDLVFAFPTYLKRAITLWISGGGNQPIGVDNIYSRNSFNEYGDIGSPRPDNVMVNDLEGALADENLVSFQSTGLTLDNQTYWNSLNDYVLSQGATLYMSSPPILIEAYVGDIEVVQAQLEGGLEFPVISELKDYIFPFEYLYDTPFHLNDIGTTHRTNQLIEDLKSAIAVGA